jgi:hypothetical protein
MVCSLGSRIASMKRLPRIEGSRWRLVATALFLACSVSFLVGTGQAAATPWSATAICAGFAIADFDGDSQPDVATVELGQVTASRAKYWIRFKLSAGARQLVSVTAPAGGLEISPRDVNGDSILDLVVTTAWLNRPVAVLLNDGHGNFTLRDPSALSTALWSQAYRLRTAAVEYKDVAAVLARSSGHCDLNLHAAQAAATLGHSVCPSSAKMSHCLRTLMSSRAPPCLVSAPFVLHV